MVRHVRIRGWKASIETVCALGACKAMLLGLAGPTKAIEDRSTRAGSARFPSDAIRREPSLHQPASHPGANDVPEEGEGSVAVLRDGL
jgi:hypothetical protein